MAPSARHTTLLLVVTVLLLFLLSFSRAAEEAATASLGHHGEVDDGEAAMGFSAAGEPCGGAGGEGEEDEECLMRRTLVAHTDYIYTQGKHH